MSFDEIDYQRSEFEIRKRQRRLCDAKVCAAAELPDRFLSQREVAAMLGIGRTTLWRAEKAGAFPPAQMISKRRKGWRLSVVNEHLDRKGQRPLK